MKRTRRALAGVSLLAVFIFLNTFLKQHVVINTTESLPYGIYRKINKVPEVGNLVAVCPPLTEATKIAYERGYIKGGDCPGHYSVILKKILAAKNDVVEITQEGVFINRQLIPNTALMNFDGEGRPLPSAFPSLFSLGANEFFCVSDYSKYSFDGRYFGKTPAGDIESVITPLFIWE